MNPAEPPRRGPGRPAVFIDKDGTLVENVPYNADVALVRYVPNAFQALARIGETGLPIFIVTNQPGLASGQITRKQYVQLQDAMERRIREESGVALAGWYTCPHAIAAGCLCRKPSTGLLRQASLAHNIDLTRSWMLGDILDDIEAGRRAGCTTILVDVGNETVWRRSPLREPHYRCTDLLAAAEIVVSHTVRA